MVNNSLARPQPFEVNVKQNQPDAAFLEVPDGNERILVLAENSVELRRNHDVTGPQSVDQLLSLGTCGLHEGARTDAALDKKCDRFPCRVLLPGPECGALTGGRWFRLAAKLPF